MPSGKSRSKDDTWTTDELSRAIKGSKDDSDRRQHRRDGEERHRRRDDDGGKDRRKRKEEVNGHDKRRAADDEVTEARRLRDLQASPEPDSYPIITEEERERKRRERREKREQKDGKPDDKKKKKRDEKPQLIEDDDDSDYVRRHRNRDDDRKHRDRDDDRKHRDRDDDRKHRDRDDDRKHRDQDDGRRHRNRDDDDRKHRDKRDDKGRRPRDDEDDYKKRHRDDDRRRNQDDDHRRRKDEGQKERERLDRGDKLHKKEKDRESKHRKENGVEKRDRRKDEQNGDRDRRNKEERSSKEKSESTRNQQSDQVKSTSSRTSEPKKQETESESEPEADEEEPYYEDDFEDYEEDFEDEEDDDDKKDGEMDEVLKALDDENTRLQSESRRSNWSDSTELSDERFRDTPATSSRGRTFINFVSAKERVLCSKTANQTRKRAEDLASMIELDVVEYDMFDLPPVREYELYIRSFGRSNTKQAYVQTNEDDVDQEAQTEDVDTKDKWTQNPAEDLVDCGGDDIDSEDVRKDVSSGKHVEMARLAMFLERAGQTIGILLEEENESQETGDKLNTESSIQLSDGYSLLGASKLLQGRHIVCASFCPSQPDMLLTVHSMPTEITAETVESRVGILCVWSVSELSSPQKILGVNCEPTCCCFSPSKAMLAFSGMTDGSVVVWDLREPASMHRSVSSDRGPVRFPTFNTAGILESDSHHSPVTSIVPVFSLQTSSHKSDNISDLSSSLSFQLATLEENGIVYLWVVAEISSPDTAGSELDLGLAPGGRIKLIKSSSITLENPQKDVRMKTSVRTSELQFMPTDLNHFYVTTDSGFIVHSVRFGSRVFPRAYSTFVESPVTVTSIDISPFVTSYFIASCDDGSLHMYHTKSQNPLITLREFSHGQSLLCARWSRSRPAVFFVLDNNSTIFVFDILENSSVPVQRDQITTGRVTSMCLSNDPKVTGLGALSRPPQMLLSLDNGHTEIHTIKKQLSEPQTLEEEFLERFVDMF